MQTDKPMLSPFHVEPSRTVWPRPAIQGRKLLIKCLTALLISASLAGTACAQATEDKTQKTVKEPSPDGQFAFLEAVAPGFEREGTVDLVEQKTGKVLLRVEEEIQVGWSAYWAPDSKRVAVVSRPGHAIQGIDVYVRRGDTFKRLELPKIGADVPKRLMRHKSFPHVAGLDYMTVDKWTSSRTLALEIATMFDGAGDSVTATRKVVFGFDQSNKIKVLKSSIKYETSHD